MQRSQFIVAAGGVAALCAAICLFVLAYIPRPPGGISHLAVFSGTRTLETEELALYMLYLKRNLTVDSFYLIGHVLMWLGYSELFRRRGVAFSASVLALGLISGALDLLENEVRWALMSLPGGLQFGPTWATVWMIIVGMSFWAILLSIAITAFLNWGEGRLQRLISVLGLICLGSIAAIYFYGYLATFVLMIIWHAASGVYLWTCRSELTEPHAFEVEPGP